MTAYSIILFFHVASALVLAAVLGVEWMLLMRLQRTTSAREAEPWLVTWKKVPWAASLSLLVLLLTGGYLAGVLAQWPLAWPKVALVALVLIGAFGGITSKRMRMARKACSEGSDAECLRRLRHPLLKISVNTKIALLFAAVLLMTATPGLYASSAIVAVGVLLGFLASMIGASKRVAQRTLEAERKSEM